MALVFTLRADNPDSTNATSYATPAFTPSADAGIVVAVLSSKQGGGSGAQGQPTLDIPSWLSGAWTEELDEVDGNDSMRMVIFSGRTISSPGSAALTASFSFTQDGCIIQAVDVTGENESDFLLQPIIAANGEFQILGTSASNTLSNPLASAESACLCFVCHNANEVQTPTDGEIELADSGHATPLRRMSAQYKINDPSSGVSWDTDSRWIIAVMEIAVEGSAVFATHYPSRRVPKHLHGPALLSNVAATKYTVPSDRRMLLRYVHVSNPSGSAVDFTLSIGTDAAGTRLFDGISIPADDYRDWFLQEWLNPDDVIQAFAGTTGVLVLTLDGYEKPPG